MPARPSRRADGRTARVPVAADFLLEIGTEELPASYLPGLIDQLRLETEVLVRDHSLTCQAIDTYGTPRRLVAIVRGLDPVQRKPGEEVRGPSKAVAFDGAGRPSLALQGFLKSQGGALDDTKLVASPKGEYVYLMKHPTETPTIKVLPALVPLVLGRIRSPKAMRWDASGIRFARPIRWLLALYGETPIAAAYGQLKSAPKSWVGAPKQPKAVSVRSLAQYQAALKAAGVILDQRVRREVIEREVTRVAKTLHGQTASEMLSHGLLEEVTYLVEQPVSLAGSFDPKYLALPREVLLASMAKHQRVFAVEASGALVPACIAILEGKPGKPEGVRAMVERILNARLADSLLFWAEDHKRLPLEQMAKALDGVTFHEKLGSMAKKAERMAALAGPIADAWSLTVEERSQLERAAVLAKADLVSTMVKEFPTLQGIVGKHYAKDSGEPRAVADAIEEHYLPSGDRLPSTPLGCALAILDKYDTLTSYVGLGIMPTGDQDPFGLRRAAQGIVEVAWQAGRPIPLQQLWSARAALPPFDRMTGVDRLAIAQKVHRYLLERLYTFAWPARQEGRAPSAPATDQIDAVLATTCDDLFDAMHRVTVLRELGQDPGMLKAAKVIERTRNILKGAPAETRQVNQALLKEDPEIALWNAYEGQRQQLTQLIQERAYAKATTLFGETFYEPLHQFFDRVLVNAPEPDLKQNRLALMQAIHTLYTGRVADLSKLALLTQQNISHAS